MVSIVGAGGHHLFHKNAQQDSQIKFNGSASGLSVNRCYQNTKSLSHTEHLRLTHKNVVLLQR